MGTSSSSKGSPSNVPMVPPWVPDPPAGPPPPPDAPPPDAPPPDAPPPAVPPPPPSPNPTDGDIDAGESGDSAVAPAVDDRARLAPPGRFGAARANLTSFARTNDRAAMRRGIGQYVSQGYGGSGTATRRMGGTIRSSEALFSALSGGPGNALQTSGAPLDSAVIGGQSADEVMDALTDAVRPVDGTQDAESSRAAIQDALSDTLERFPDANLLNLTDEQKGYAVEVFVASDIYGRLFLDLGTKVIESAPSTAAGLSRLKEIRDYVRETIVASFRTLREKGISLSKGRVSTVVREAVQETFIVFEGYAL
jgi:hypothetical protein